MITLTGVERLSLNILVVVEKLSGVPSYVDRLMVVRVLQWVVLLTHACKTLLSFELLNLLVLYRALALG